MQHHRLDAKRNGTIWTDFNFVHIGKVRHLKATRSRQPEHTSSRSQRLCDQAPRRRRPLRAFTLIEAVATIVVLAVLGSLASTIIVEATDGYFSGQVHAQLHTEASIGMDRIVRELRNIPLDEDAPDIAPDIDAVTNTSITWQTNNSLSLNGTDLELVNDGAASRVLLSNVSAFSIQTYDESNNALNQPLQATQCDPIRRVQISVTLTRHGESETLRAKIFLRSTMAGAGGS